jgi:probable F420-dependent oxidoreductase
VDVGVFSHNTEFGMAIDQLAQDAEARGFDSLWVTDHSHIPASRAKAFPGGGELPKHFFHMADPFVSLTAAAIATDTIKIGTCVCLLSEREPISLAKTVATLDRISGGRFQFGVAGGWIAEAMENHGTPFKKRWQVVRERVEAMKAIWTQEEASYEGEFVKFEKIISYPKPLQAPHPPIIMGSASALARKRAVRYCDGWIPVDTRVEDLPGAMADLKRDAEEAGRDPASIPISIFCAGDTTPDTLRRYRDMGADRAVVVVPSEDANGVLPFLDTFAAVMPELKSP